MLQACSASRLYRYINYIDDNAHIHDYVTSLPFSISTDSRAGFTTVDQSLTQRQDVGNPRSKSRERERELDLDTVGGTERSAEENLFHVKEPKF